jgi:hypothetical protein
MSRLYTNNIALTTRYKTTNAQTGPNTNYKDVVTDIGNSFKLYMFGSRNICKYYVGIKDIGNYYQFDAYTNAIINDTRLGSSYSGAYNMPPWNVTETKMQNAKWIWNNSDAANAVAPYVYLWFYYTFFYSGADNTGTLYAVCDNIGTFYLNQGTGIVITSGWPGTNVSADRGNITIKNGLNYIRVSAYNDGPGNNPAGLLVTIVDSNGTAVANSNSDWAYGTSNAYQAGADTYNTIAT